MQRNFVQDYRSVVILLPQTQNFTRKGDVIQFLRFYRHFEGEAVTDREYPDRPIVGVGVVVLGPDGILLVRRGKPPRQGSWGLPGGAQERGETVDEAAVREVAEETGLKIDVLGLVDVVDSIDCDNSGRIQYHYTLIDLLAVVVDGGLNAGSDVDGVGWFQENDLDRLQLWSETRRVINLAIEMKAALGLDVG